MTNEVIFSQKEHLGVIMLNRPKALNALTLGMIQAMQKQLDQWKDDAHIHAVILTATPGKAFCAGGDVRWLYEAGINHSPEQMKFFEHEYQLNLAIHQFPKPYISLMDGMTMGGGVGISMHGSHPVASERFVFAMPETGIGFFPDIGASYLLSRCPDSLGIYLGLTGERLGAEMALDAGLVSHVVKAEQLRQLVDLLCRCDLSHAAHAQINACLDSLSFLKKQETFNVHEPIAACFSQSSIQSILSALKSRQTEWAENTYGDLLNKAPLSLKVTLEQIKRAQDLSLAECLKMDYVLVGHFMQDHDFYEGVRALLIDKDKSPHWIPNDLSLVSESMVANYFESRVIEFRGC